MRQVSRSTEGDGEPVPEGEPGAVIPISDRVLLARHLQGERGAFAQLMKSYSTPIYGYLTRSGIAAGERDDLFQEIFIKVHRGAAGRSDNGAVKPWIWTIAVNTVRDHFRRNKVRSVVHSHSETAEGAISRADGPERAAEGRQTAAWMEQEIAQLPLAQREALLMCALQGLALQEAATALSVPVDTVKTRLRRARLTLAQSARRRRQRLEQEQAQ